MGAGEFTPDLAGLDRLLEHRVRLAVAVLLTRYDRMSFTRLRDLTDETDGNIGAHLRRLEEGGYVQVDKTFRDRKPLTRYSLTVQGRQELRRHLRALQSLVEGAGISPAPSDRTKKLHDDEHDDEVEET